MDEKTSSDEVDLFVDGVAPDSDSPVEASRFIAAYKQRPDYQAKVEEAKKILADLGIKPHDHGMANAKSLLEHWHQCIADLTGNGAQRAHARNANEKARSSE